MRFYWPWQRRQTIDEWAKEYGFRVLDPDGFDRHDPKLMYRRFTKKEWERGYPLCTIDNVNATL